MISKTTKNLLIYKGGGIPLFFCNLFLGVFKKFPFFYTRNQSRIGLRFYLGTITEKPPAIINPNLLVISHSIGGIKLLKIAKKFITTLIVLALLIIPSIASGAEEKISFMYLYGGTTAEYIQQFQLARGSINIVSPNFFELDAEGNLIENIDQTLTKFMHQQNVKVVPYLSNHWDRASAQKALQNPEKLANTLANSVNTYNLDGVNIDLENLTYEDRNQLTIFASILRNKLAPQGKTVSIAVGAVDKPTNSGWKSAYDLKNLGNVVDFIIIMAYDQHWRTSGPGPIASLPWVTQQLDYMLTQIPKEKTVLGVPFYGRVWTNGQNGGGIWYSDIIAAAPSARRLLL